MHPLATPHVIDDPKIAAITNKSASLASDPSSASAHNRVSATGASGSRAIEARRRRRPASGGSSSIRTKMPGYRECVRKAGRKGGARAWTVEQPQAPTKRIAVKSLFAISPVCRAGMGLDVPFVFKGAARISSGASYTTYLNYLSTSSTTPRARPHAVDSPPGVEELRRILTFLVFDC